MGPEEFTGFIRVVDLKINPDVIKLLPQEIMEKYDVIPLWFDGEALVIACPEPSNETILREIATAAKRPLRPMLASVTDIRFKLNSLLSRKHQTVPMPGIGEILYLLGYLSESDLSQVRQERLKGINEWRFISANKLVSEEELAEATGWLEGRPYLTLSNFGAGPNLIPLIPWNVVTEKKVIPLWWFNGILIAGVLESESRKSYEDLEELCGFPIWTVVLPTRTWENFYRRTYLRGRSQQFDDPEAIISKLFETGRLSELDREGAETVVKQTGLPVEEVLVNNGLITRRDWLETRAKLYDVPIVKGDRGKSSPASELRRLIAAPIARSFSAVPLWRENGKVIVGMYTPIPEVVEFIKKLTELEIVPEMMDESEITKRISAIYPPKSPSDGYELPGLGEFLVSLGYITKFEVEEVLAGDYPMGFNLGDGLVAKGYLSDHDVAQALSLYTGLPYARLDYARFDKQFIDLIPANVARQCNLMPLWAGEKDMWVATANPLDGKKLRIAEEATGYRIWPLIAPRAVVTAAVNRFYGTELRKIDYRIINLIESLVEKGILTQTGASTVLEEYSEGNVPLDRAITDVSHYKEYDVLKAVAEIIGIQPISLQLFETEENVIDPLGNAITKMVSRDPVDIITASLIDAATARRLSALPVIKDGSQIVVAFANPEFHADLETIQSILGESVVPRLVGRSDLEEAVHRTLERGNIGSRLLLAGLITREQLNDGLDLAKRTGVRLGRALVNRRYVSQQQLSQFLADQANIPFGTLEGVEFDWDLVNEIGPEAARNYGILPVRADQDQVLLAVVDPLDEEAMRVANQRLNRNIRPVLVTEQDMEAAFEYLFSDEYVAQSVSELLERSPRDSAYHVLSQGQKIGLIALIVLSFVWIFIDARSYFITINVLATLFYITFSSYRFYLVYKAVSRELEVPVTDEEVAALNDRELPVYTILIPVYKEAKVLVDLLDAVRNMNYPTTKMDIKVLMEEDDEETIQAFKDWNPPSHFEGIVVPYALPKTKPKACNYGLIHARGEYVVIYDAEDRPDSDQLKRILVAFSKASPDVVCIQAKLNYYNRHQNLLTRWFTVEYSMWFDLFLPGLDASDAPIPLGGTSNHFKRDALIEAGAWDPYNVTEDADLGIRIHKRGYKTAVVDSTTYEEANSHVYNWIRQRSRWIKGYIQTWLVHMRDPIKLIKRIGFKSFLAIQFVVAGTFFSALVNPIYWILTTLWFFFEWDFIQQIFPGIIFYMGAICLFVGNFAFTYMNVAGAMRRGYYDFVKYALLSPLYWGLASVAAWRGFYQLIVKPYFWEKTVHGLYEPKVEPEAGSQKQL